MSDLKKLSATKVKPLVWECIRLNGWKRGRYAARSTVSSGWAAYINRVDGGWMYRGNVYSSALDGIDVALDCAMLEAQADYEAAVLSAIEPTTDTRAEIRAEAFREAAKVVLSDSHTPKEEKTWVDDRPYVCEETTYRAILDLIDKEGE